MASIEDVGIDIDFGFENPVDSNGTQEVILAEEEQRTNSSVINESCDHVKSNRFSPSENKMQPEYSSSESSVDLNAPVGGSNATGDVDDDEFDFVVTKKEPPKMEIGNNLVEKVSEAHSSKEKLPGILPPQEMDIELNPAQLNNERDSDADLRNSSPIQWKTAQKEWNNVTEVQLESDDEENEHVSASNTPIISSQEAFHLLKNDENVLSLYRNQIVTTVHRSGFQAFLYTLFGPPRLKRSFIQDRDVIFSTALHPYNSNNRSHFRMLLSVYKSLTGNNLDCPKFGGHWDEIGFQGDDPGTDFRGTGMLGLLCLLNLSCPKTEVGVAGDVGCDERSNVRHELSLALHRLSRDPEQNFPLAIMSINWTRLLLQTLREGALNKSLNASCGGGRQFCEAFLELHTAVAFRFLTVWRRGHKTILDSGLVLRDLEDALRKNAVGLLKEWNAHLAGDNATSGAAGHRNKRSAADRYAVSATAAPDAGVAELSMLK